MSFDIIRTLIVSIGHLTREDLDLIPEHIEFVVEYDRYIVLVKEAMSRKDELSKIGLSEGFTKSVLMAWALGCERVEFSYDGKTIEEIPVYLTLE